MQGLVYKEEEKTTLQELADLKIQVLTLQEQVSRLEKLVQKLSERTSGMDIRTTLF